MLDTTLDPWNCTLTSPSSENLPTPRVQLDPYALYLACLELTLVLPIVFGNTLIVVSVIRFPRLQVITNALIVSLASADLCVGLGAAPIDAAFHLAASLHTNQTLCLLRYTIQVTLCLLKYTIQLVGLGGSMTSLTVISIDRFLAVTFPLMYHSRVTSLSTAGALTAAWLSVVAMVLPPLLGYHRWSELPPDTTCDVAHIYHDNYVDFILVLSICLLTVNMALYACVIKTAFKQMARVHKVSAIVTEGVATNTVYVNANRRARREMKKSRMMAFVLGVFIVCYLPYAILAPLKHHYGGYPLRVARDVSVVLIMANSCMNSIIYGAMNLDFRCAYYQLLGCRRRCGPHGNGVWGVDAATGYLDNKNADTFSYASSVAGFSAHPTTGHDNAGPAPIDVMRCYSHHLDNAENQPEEPNNNNDNTGQTNSSGVYPTLPTVVD